jgi:hypothetical protein
MKVPASVVVASLVLNFVSSYQYGVDLSVATTDETWKCLKSDYNVSYALIRVYRSNGLLDENSAASLISAHNAGGIRDLHVYIFPCVTSSAYSQSHSIICDSPADQITKSIEYLESNGVKVWRKGDSESEVSGPIVRRLWLDVEDEDPSTYYDKDVTVNQALLTDLISSGEKEGVLMGIYTTKTYWTNIMGGVEGYSSFPLWYPR